MIQIADGRIHIPNEIKNMVPFQREGQDEACIDVTMMDGTKLRVDFNFALRLANHIQYVSNLSFDNCYEHYVLKIPRENLDE